MLMRRFLPLWQFIPDSGPNESVENTLMTGLVCSYQFENASDLGHDDFGFINVASHGSTGSVTQVTGKNGFGVTCTGKYLRGDGATSVDPTSGITICGWFKTDANSGGNRILASLSEAATGHTSANPDVRLDLNSTGSYGAGHIPKISFYDSGDSYRHLSASAISDPTQWHFFVVRFANGAQSIQIDNGTLTTSSYTLDVVLNAGQNLKRVELAVASGSDSVTADGVLIYNRILTGYESDVLFNLTAGRFYPFAMQAEAEASQSTAEVGGYAIAAPAGEASLSTAEVGGSAFVPGIGEASLSTAAVTAAFVAAVPESSASTAEVTQHAVIPAIGEASLSTAAVGGYVFAPGSGEASLSTAEAEETYGAEPAVGEASLSAAEVGGTAGTPPRGEASLSTADAGGYVTIPAYGEASLSTAAAETVHPVTDPAIAEASLSTASVVATAGTPPRGEASLSTASAQYVRGDDMMTVNVSVTKVNNVTAGNGKLQVNEQDTARVVFDLVDETNTPIDIELIRSLLITVTTGAGNAVTVIRPTEEGIAAQFVTLRSVGGRSLLTWDMQSFESRVINRALTSEDHYVTLELCWYPAEELTLTADPFTTASSSMDITVTHPAHGLRAGRDSIVVQGAADVASVDPDGIYTLTEIVDGDHYKIRHKTQAAAAATSGGGGSVRVLVSPRRKTLIQTLSVKRSDLT